ncbi:MAG: hypothetical protein GY816_13680 [Cytophagales bacterium]|nr:hypothetical protein [Cytophagales bacterium]
MIFFLSSCARSCTESALSDVVINDPGILILEMSIDKELSNQGEGSERINVWVRDKNGQALTLKEGLVEVNGAELSINKSLIGNLPYYHSSGAMAVEEGTNYKATITLGDGKSYASTIDLPGNNLRRFDTPDYQQSSESLVLTWNEIDPKYDVTVSWNKHVASDSSFRIVRDYTIIDNNQTQLVLEPNFFNENFGVVKHIDFTITSEKHGKVSSDFRSDSFFNSTFSASRRIVMDEPGS